MPPALVRQAVRLITINSVHTLDGVAISQTTRRPGEFRNPSNSQAQSAQLQARLRAGPFDGTPSSVTIVNITQGLGGGGLERRSCFWRRCMELDEADLWEEQDNVNHTGTWYRVWLATAVCCGCVDSQLIFAGPGSTGYPSESDSETSSSSSHPSLSSTSSNGSVADFDLELAGSVQLRLSLGISRFLPNRCLGPWTI